MLNLFCRMVRLCPKPLPKKLGLIWLNGGFFTSFIQDTNVIVGLRMLTTGANVTTVLYEQGKKLNLV